MPDAPQPRIAITPWLRSLPTALGERTALYTLDPAYAERVLDAGGLPYLVARGVPASAALEAADGLLLSGGGDVDPATYGGDSGAPVEDADAATDAWELSLLAEARRRGLPTFGICRGLQLLAVAEGGTLAVHVDGDVHPGMGALPPADALALRHEVTLEPGSRVGRALGPAVRVNTIHHQAVEDPGSLRVIGRGPDGVIEALEAEGWPAFGVQWHPEKMPEPEQRRLFEAFVALAAERRGARVPTWGPAPPAA